MFEGRFGTKEKPVAVRLLNKGFDPETLALALDEPGAAPKALPRLAHRISTYYVAFGPLRIEGLPLLAAHMYVPPRNRERWEKGSKIVYLTPMEALAGELTVGGRKVRVGLLDVNLDGVYLSPCRHHAREGDWFLFDENGDGKFTVRYSDGEGRGLTEMVPLNGRHWTLRLEGRRLLLRSCAPRTFSLRFQGMGEDADIYAWSAVTGLHRGSLDDGRMTLPRGPVTLYSYNSRLDGWRLTGSLRSLGEITPPVFGDDKIITLGAPLRLTLKHTLQSREHRFQFRCLDASGASVSVMNGNKRSAVFLVIRDRAGKEVFRQSMRFG